MSQEARDARLRLTGLTPKQRDERIRQLGSELALKQAEAQEKREKRRAELRRKPVK
jgi:hypothetical protein